MTMNNKVFETVARMMVNHTFVCVESFIRGNLEFMRVPGKVIFSVEHTFVTKSELAIVCVYIKRYDQIVCV